MKQLLFVFLLMMSFNLLAAEGKRQINYETRIEMVNKLHDMRRDFGEEGRKKHLAFLESAKNSETKPDYRAFKTEMKARRVAFKAELKQTRQGHKEKMKQLKNQQ